jgi:sugar phosphate isomerase/epimerase
MRLGIFAKTFRRPTLDATLDAVRANGLNVIQFNLETAGLESMPAEIPDSAVAGIRQACDARGIEIAALSGTFNMIHPDPAVVAEGLKSLEGIIAVAKPLGASMVTLCTGTRDAANMWRRHPDNDSAEAWTALLDATEQALVFAERNQVALGVETEPGNVVNSAKKCRALLDEFSSPWLKVIFDPANLIMTDLAREPSDLLDEAIAMLGRDVTVAHAKECGPDGEIVPAGDGIVPWDLVISGLNAQAGGNSLPLIMHGLEEDDVARAATFLRARIADSA